ncbi:MAG TPA: hypothetical protein VF095_10490 [Bacillota bacterium]
MTAAAPETEVKVTQLEREKVTETVMVPGQLKFAEQQMIYYTPENGKVEEILVKEGDKVDQRTPLICYKNNELELKQEQTEIQLRSANLDVRGLQEQHKDIDELLEDDEDNEQL